LERVSLSVYSLIRATDAPRCGPPELQIMLVASPRNQHPPSSRWAATCVATTIRIGDLRQTRVVMLEGKLLDADALRKAAGYSGRPK
jgi:hypothetical protein